jgi:hypothetical protein
MEKVYSMGMSGFVENIMQSVSLTSLPPFIFTSLVTFNLPRIDSTFLFSAKSFFTNKVTLLKHPFVVCERHEDAPGKRRGGA